MQKETHFKLSGREKANMILRYLRGNLWFFVSAILFACLGMVFNALTPQIIRVTVDSILGNEPAELPAAVERFLPLEALRADPIRALWIAVGAVVLAAGYPYQA